MWNKAYVTAHFPGSYSDRKNSRGQRVIGWYVHIPKIDVSGPVRWHYQGTSAKNAWWAAAEALAEYFRRREASRRGR